MSRPWRGTPYRYGCSARFGAGGKESGLSCYSEPHYAGKRAFFLHNEVHYSMKDRFLSLLRRSERYTHIDMVYLAKGGSWMSGGQAINMLVGFLVSIAFANLLPKESFGTYKFILSTVALIGIFSFLDIGTAVIQSVAKGFGNSLRQGFRANLQWSLGVSLAGFALSLYYYVQGNNLLSFAFLLAGIL